MEELIRGYADGQISRRVFIRRMVAAGVALTGAVVYADLLAANPAAAQDYFVVDVTDYVFTPHRRGLNAPGDYVTWAWDPFASGHTVSDASGCGFFDSSPEVWYVDEHGTHWTSVKHLGREFWAAGTFPYRCKYGDGYHAGHAMGGKIRVPTVLGAASGRAGKEFEVTWGAGDLLERPQFRYEVQFRKPGGEWKDWVTDGQSPAGTYTAKTIGKHQFRARLRRQSSGASGWSPVATFTAK